MRMLSTLAMQVGRFGFFGIGGFPGIILGLIVFIIFVAILWKLLTLVLPKLSLDATWMEVIKWLVILGLFIVLLHILGIY